MPRLRVLLQPGTGYEFLISLTMLADRTSMGRVDAATDLRRRAKEINGGELLKSIETIGREPTLNLLGLVHAMTEEPTAANAIAAIEDAPADELVLAALGAYRRAYRIPTPLAVFRGAIIDRDPDAIRQFKRTSYPEIRA